MKTTALIYVRQSAKDKNSISPETQEAACRTLPAVAACSEVIVYRDLGISGGQPPEKRPGFLAMRERIKANDKAKEPILIATYNQDRISRDNVDSLQFYAFVDERPWVDFAMVDGHFERSAAGEFTWAVMAATASHLRRITAKKIKDAYADLNKAGAPTGPAPFGYKYVGNTRKTAVLEFDPVTAPVVLRIFSGYANGGGSTRDLAEQLNHDKVPASGTSTRGWIPDTVAGMLRNVAYIGKTYSVSRLKRKGELIQAQWPPLIEDVLFQRVQDRLNAKQAKLPHGTSKREFAFRGLLWCPECGRRFHASHNFGINWYRCGSGETTQQCAMGKNALKESELLPWADKILTWPPLGGTPTRKHEPMQQESAVDAVAKMDRMIKRLGTRFQSEEVAEKEYHSELARLRRQRDAYVAMAATEPDPADLATLAGQWNTGDPAIRHRVLSALFERIHVKDRKVIGYTPRIDRAKRVKVLIATAFDYAQDGPGAASGTLREQRVKGI